jgi:hypothetical protein
MALKQNENCKNIYTNTYLSIFNINLLLCCIDSRTSQHNKASDHHATKRKHSGQIDNDRRHNISIFAIGKSPQSSAGICSDKLRWFRLVDCIMFFCDETESQNTTTTTKKILTIPINTKYNMKNKMYGTLYCDQAL